MSQPKQIDNGLLIAFEGADGVGKTTQLELAAKALSNDGWPVRTTHNLGGSPIGEALRKVFVSDVPRPPATDLYTCVAISEALAQELDAERQAGKIILIDRCPLSLVAYEAYGSGLDESLVWRYADQGMDKFRPELVIMYTADLDIALKRARRQTGGKGDYFESKPRSYFEKVLQGYQAACERYEVVTIDASRPIEAVQEETMRVIDQAIKHKHR